MVHLLFRFHVNYFTHKPNAKSIMFVILDQPKQP